MIKVPDKAKFLCWRCNDVLCDDCAGVAAEYEYLYERQKLELIGRDRIIEDLRSELKEAKEDARFWEDISKIPLPVMIQAWLDAEAAKSRKAGRESMRRELKKAGILDKLQKLEKSMARAGTAKKSDVTRCDK